MNNRQNMNPTQINPQKTPIREEARADANRLRRFAAGLGGLFCAICVLLPSPAKAECRQWYAGFEWSLKQGDLEVFVDLQQSGKNLSGIAAYRTTRSKDRGLFVPDGIVKVDRKGKVAGTIDGTNITLDMEWEDGSGGFYTGVIGATGIIRGTVNVDKENPTNKWSWVSRKPMFCADKADKKPKPTPSATPAPASPKRLIKSSGKSQTETSSSAGVPRIAAFNKPGQAGTQILTWDGGPDHPYAEVWVKVDGADETKVVEQGKGTRQMTVEAGKTYQYILTDSGQQLATTSVQAK